MQGQLIHCQLLGVVVALVAMVALVARRSWSHNDEARHLAHNILHGDAVIQGRQAPDVGAGDSAAGNDFRGVFATRRIYERCSLWRTTP